MLEEVKQRLSITGHDLDPTINGMIDDVVAFCLSAGVKYSQLVKPDVIGLIARGVADLWNYGAGDGKFSQVFHMRLNQLCIAAYSIEGDLLPQSKEVTITENGTTEITPDEGYLLTGVTVDTAVPGKPEQTKAVSIRQNGVTEVTPDAGHVLTGVTVEAAVPEKPEQVKTVTITENGTVEITPDEGKVLSRVTATVNVQAAEYNILAPSYTYTPYTGLIASITVVDMSNIVGIEEASDLSYLFYNLKRLQTIHWGDKEFKASNVSSMFAKCEALESVLLPKFIRSISSFTYMFDGCKKIKNIDLTSVSFSMPSSIASVFNGCKSLESVNFSTLDTRQVTSADNVFGSCTSLANIIFPENLFPNKGFDDLNLSACPLTHDCAVDIFNKLATRTNSPTLKLSSTTKGYLTESEIAIATGKGWVVS